MCVFFPSLYYSLSDSDCFLRLRQVDQGMVESTGSSSFPPSLAVCQGGWPSIGYHGGDRCPAPALLYHQQSKAAGRMLLVFLNITFGEYCCCNAWLLDFFSPSYYSG
ncbi:hypothetical protein PAHAL_6G271900 [Panicum hallii]|uniref:Uncharacterized protein n=1 Tax=Panicum hallii TaxID=206008 RepID=A0A2T8IHR1_9POAL|nr:hypothetical protein PAHAL_6G271900 [Panicum hallii]